MNTNMWRDFQICISVPSSFQKIGEVNQITIMFYVPFYQTYLRLLYTLRLTTEAVAQRCSVKKVFSEILQNSQENNCARAPFLMKVQALGLRPAALLKKRLWYRCFLVNFAKFLRTSFLTKHLRQLLPLLVAKLDAYGFNRDTLLRINGTQSYLGDIILGVPKGSIL